MKFFFYPFFLTSLLTADEGMWPLNSLPLKEIEDRYGFEIQKEWIEHLQKSAVRISAGGSGSFVSKQGLILTNHHVGESAIYNLSTAEKNLLESGFLAKNQKEELKCPNLYVDRLIEIRDVTDQINKEEGPDDEARGERLHAAIAEVERRAHEETALQPEVVSLYRGARYHLYLYERISDIRLVMAPEKSIAFFGGDGENFEYPRTVLDFCFFRGYKNNEPLQTESFLKWSKEGPHEEELLFVIGHPGKTGRALTSSHLKFLKEYDNGKMVQWLKELRDDLFAFSDQNPENLRKAQHRLGGIKNTLKVLDSFTEERWNSLSKMKEGDEDPSELKEMLEEAKSYWISYLILERSSVSQLFSWARHLLRYSEEKEKPNEARLKEYTDSELDTLQLDLFSERPLYKDLERVLLRNFFNRAIRELGPEHSLTKRFLEINIDQLLETQLDRLEVRKKLFRELGSLTDPMLLFTKEIDSYGRELRKKKEERYDLISKEAYTKLTQAAFARCGNSFYPDATFTLRLSYGKLKGYNEGEKELSPMTLFKQLYTKSDLHSNEEDYFLSEVWQKRKNDVDQEIPLNFVSTHDIIGGNSGSPVVNREGEVVGLIFDGNIYSNLWYFAYDDTQGRSISVHSKAIVHALQTIYKANDLVDELLSLCRSDQR